MAGVKTQKGGAVNAAPPRVVLTRHTCATCATLIMSNEVSSVIEISFEGGKKQRARVFYHKAHSPKA
jgi:hypothetical protein